MGEIPEKIPQISKDDLLIINEALAIQVQKLLENNFGVYANQVMDVNKKILALIEVI